MNGVSFVSSFLQMSQVDSVNNGRREQTRSNNTGDKGNQRKEEEHIVYDDSCLSLSSTDDEGEGHNNNNRIKKSKKRKRVTYTSSNNNNSRDTHRQRISSDNGGDSDNIHLHRMENTTEGPVFDEISNNRGIENNHEDNGANYTDNDDCDTNTTNDTSAEKTLVSKIRYPKKEENNCRSRATTATRALNVYNNFLDSSPEKKHDFKILQGIHSYNEDPLQKEVVIAKLIHKYKHKKLNEVFYNVPPTIHPKTQISVTFFSGSHFTANDDQEIPKISAKALKKYLKNGVDKIEPKGTYGRPKMITDQMSWMITEACRQAAVINLTPTRNEVFRIIEEVYGFLNTTSKPLSENVKKNWYNDSGRERTNQAITVKRDKVHRCLRSYVSHDSLNRALGLNGKSLTINGNKEQHVQYPSFMLFNYDGTGFSLGSSNDGRIFIGEDDYQERQQTNVPARRVAPTGTNKQRIKLLPLIDGDGQLLNMIIILKGIEMKTAPARNQQDTIPEYDIESMFLPDVTTFGREEFEDVDTDHVEDNDATQTSQSQPHVEEDDGISVEPQQQQMNEDETETEEDDDIYVVSDKKYTLQKQKEQLELLKKLKIFPLRNYVHFEPVETISDAQCQIQFAVVPKGLDDELFFEVVYKTYFLPNIKKSLTSHLSVDNYNDTSMPGSRNINKQREIQQQYFEPVLFHDGENPQLNVSLFLFSNTFWSILIQEKKKQKLEDQIYIQYYLLFFFLFFLLIN